MDEGTLSETSDESKKLFAAQLEQRILRNQALKVRNRVSLLQVEERRMLKKIELARQQAETMALKRENNDKIYLEREQ